MSKTEEEKQFLEELRALCKKYHMRVYFNHYIQADCVEEGVSDEEVDYYINDI